MRGIIYTRNDEVLKLAVQKMAEFGIRLGCNVTTSHILEEMPHDTLELVHEKITLII